MARRRPPRPAPPVVPAPAAVAPAARFAPIAVGVFVTALVVRLVHVWQMRGSIFWATLLGDSRGYDAWARALAAGDWLGREVFYQAPLYPYFLGATYALVGDDLLIVRVIQAALGAVSCTALAYAAAQLLPRPAGLVAGLMLALYPPAIFFDGLLQKSVLDVLFVCLTLAVVARLVAQPGGGRSRTWTLLGLALGALALTRENALVLVAVALAWAVVRGRSPRPAALAPAVWMIAGLALVLGPVVWRNYAVGGGLYLTTSQFGSNLYIGNNPQADGSYVALRPGRGSPEYERLDATELAEQARGRPLTPSEVSAYWTERTIDDIRAQPARWLRLLARKTWLLVNAAEMIDTESQESHADYSAPLRLLGSVWHFGVLAPLAVLGLPMVWRRRALWPIVAMAAGYALSVVLFFVVARYRYPIVPFAILSAAAAVSGGREWMASASRPQAAALLAAAGAVALAANWPVHSGDARRAITENNLGTALQEEGRLDEAAARYRRALALDPGYTPALNNLGTALRAAGRVDEAIAVYREALARQPGAAGVHFNLGNAMLAQGRPAAAIVEFRQALAANPAFVEAHNNLGLALEAAGRLDAAIAAFREALALDGRSAPAHRNLGNGLATRGEVASAFQHLRRAIELDPANAAAHYDLGSLALETGDVAAAELALGEAVRLDPADAEAHNNLGIALASRGRVDEAVAHWREALRIEPGLADARQNLERAGIEVRARP